MKAHKLCLVVLLSCLSLRACPFVPPLACPYLLVPPSMSPTWLPLACSYVASSCLSLCGSLLPVPTWLALACPYMAPSYLSYVDPSCLFPTWLPLACPLRAYSILSVPTRLPLLPAPPCLPYPCLSYMLTLPLPVPTCPCMPTPSCLSLHAYPLVPIPVHLPYLACPFIPTPSCLSL